MSSSWNIETTNRVYEQDQKPIGLPSRLYFWYSCFKNILGVASRVNSLYLSNSTYAFSTSFFGLMCLWWIQVTLEYLWEILNCLQRFWLSDQWMFWLHLLSWTLTMKSTFRFHKVLKCQKEFKDATPGLCLPKELNGFKQDLRLWNDAMSATLHCLQLIRCKNKIKQIYCQSSLSWWCYPNI